MERVFEKSHAFFALPDEIKEEYSVMNNCYFRGYVPNGDETTHYAKNKRANYDFSIDRVPLDPRDESIPLAFRMFSGPNIWPREEHVPGFKEVVDTYFQRCYDANFQLLHLILERLGYPEDKLDVYDRWFGRDTKHGPALNPGLLAKLAFYPPPSPDEIINTGSSLEPKKWIQGCGPHTDTSFFTFLAQDRPGLQIQLHSGKWIDAPVLPDTLVINFGRQLADLTHGALEATTHRVNSALVDGPRMSLPYFLVPDFFNDMPKFIDEGTAERLCKPYRAAAVKEVVTDVDPDWDGDRLELMMDRWVHSEIESNAIVASWKRSADLALPR